MEGKVEELEFGKRPAMEEEARGRRKETVSGRSPPPVRLSAQARRPGNRPGPGGRPGRHPSHPAWAGWEAGPSPGRQ